MSDGLEDVRLYGVTSARIAFGQVVATWATGPARVAALEAMVGALADELESARMRAARMAL